MKKLFRQPIVWILAALARSVIRKYKPTIIMVTGSVGKTSTKDATAAALQSRGYLRASEKSYNSEFGVPLTILGAANPWTSPVAWTKVVIEGLLLLLLPNRYPNTLILEVGADRPGDLRRILRFATPDAVIVTQLPAMPIHVEAYASPAAVREEEFTPAYALTPGAPLVVSADDSFAQDLAAPLAVVCTTYGYAPHADVRVMYDAPLVEDGDLTGMQATLVVRDEAGKHKTYPLMVRGAIGRPQLLAPAAGVALAYALDMNVETALKDVAGYVPPPGRGRIIAGIKNSTLIDDTYNASPVAVCEALDTLTLAANAVGEGTPARRIAVIGDMLELGRYSKEEHERVGTYAATHADVVVAVGSRSVAIADAARAAGMEVYTAKDSHEAANVVGGLIADGDIVLVKGSQSMRMERVMFALLRNPSDASLLVRQDPAWMRI